MKLLTLFRIWLLIFKAGRFLLWQHIKDILAMNEGLKISMMKVNLAVQTKCHDCTTMMLKSMQQQNVVVVVVVVDFFDIMNVRNSKEHATKRNPLLKPFSEDDSNGC